MNHFWRASLLALLFILSLSTVTEGQRTRTRPAEKKPVVQPSPLPAPSRPTPTLVESINTTDGRVIRLFDDKTYSIEVLPKRVQPLNVTVGFRVAVITGGGDVKPAARTDFIVFKEDIREALSTVPDRDGKALTPFSLYLADDFRLVDNGRTYQAAMEKLRPSILTTFTTGFDGSGSFSVPRGTEYFIYGYVKIGRSACLWYSKFPADKDGSYVLENRNAIYCG